MAYEGAVIQLDHVYAGYGGPPVLTDLNVTVNAGEFVGVVGPNGGGKTTFLRLILGLVPNVNGRVRVFGMSPQEARPKVGYVPQRQEFDRRFPVTAADVALMGRLGNAPPLLPYPAADRETVRRTLETVGAEHLAREPFGALSGGQQQRVLIARALACDPQMLLLDEPMSNLDEPAEREMYELLRRLNERMTIVLVSHDIGVITAQVSVVICVNRRMVMHPTSEITDDILLGIYGGAMRLVRHDHKCATRHVHE